MTKNNLLRILSFFIFPALVFIINLPLDFLYDLYPWIDIPMHFFGGLSIAFTSVLFLNFFDEKNLLKIRDPFIFIFVVSSFVVLVAVLWEFYEFFLQYFFGIIHQLGLEDTLLDLATGLGGGIVGGIVFRKV